MADETSKPAGKPPASSAPKDEPGRIEVDDRGNITWQWTDNELLADDTLGAAERIRALVDPRLKVEETPEEIASVKGLKTGYNPYQSGPLGKREWKKKKNLRELSKWIELRKKLENKKDE